MAPLCLGALNQLSLVEAILDYTILVGMYTTARLGSIIRHDPGLKYFMSVGVGKSCLSLLIRSDHEPAKKGNISLGTYKCTVAL